MTIVYYISGHGFGHARRSAQVMRQLLLRRPDIRLVIRTTAPPAIFHLLPAASVRHVSVSLDQEVIENDPLTIDIQRCVQAMQAFLSERQQRVAAEVASLRPAAPSLILADASFLAGDVAEALGVPCYAVTNFTWDWIYEGFMSRNDGALLEPVRCSYARMTGLLRIPFGGVGRFQRIFDVPLVTTQSRRPRDCIERQLSVREDRRPRCLVGMRGGVAERIIARAAAESPDTLFLVPSRLQSPMPDNVKCCPTGPDLDFSDIVRVSDVVLSKLGYGILADCLAERVALLWPRRHGFVEDEVSRPLAERHIAMLELPHEDFFNGHWGYWIRRVIAQPRPSEPVRTDGAEVCADLLLSLAGD